MRHEAEVVAGWPLLPRPHATAPILNALRRGSPSAQLITGAAGVGKSVLAEQVLDGLPGRETLRVTGLIELASVPLAALAGVRAELGIAAEPEEAVAAIVSAAGARRAELSLLVDDAPRLDPVSAGVVFSLIRVVGLPTVLTARLGEPLPEAMIGLVEQGRIRTHSLGGWATSEVADLLRLRFGHPVLLDDARRITRRTDGNPLYVRSLVDSADAEGGVRDDGELVRIDDGQTPVDLIASISRRIQSLPPRLRRQLHLITLTQPVERDLVAPDRRSVNDLQALALGGFIVTHAGRRIGASHPLFGEVLDLDDMADEVRRHAAILLRKTGEPADRFKAAELLRDVDRLPRDELVWAASYALSGGDPRRALQLASLALDEAEDFEAALVAATSAGLAGRLSDADEFFDRALARARDPQDLIRLAGRRGEHLAFRCGDAAAALSQAQAIVASVPPDDAGALESDMRIWRVQIGEVDPADTSEGSIADPTMAARNAAMTVLISTLSGDIAAGESLEREVLTELGDGPSSLGMMDPTAAAMFGFNRFIGLVTSGKGAAAREYIDDRRTSGSGDTGLWSFISAQHALYAGRLEEAADRADLALHQLRWRDDLGATLVATELKALITAQAGSVEEAHRIRKGQGTYPSMLPTTGQLIAETRAWIALGRNDPAKAADLVFAAAAESRDLGFRFVAALGLTFAIRIGEVARAATELREIIDELDGEPPLYRGLADMAGALAEGRPDAVLDAAAVLVACDLTPTALDGITLALRQRPNATTRRGLERMYAVLANKVDVPLLQTQTASVLSERELAVAVRAARRERSQEIAAALGRSVSTVNNQLQSAYRKLGVSGRDELRSALQEIGALRATTTDDGE